MFSIYDLIEYITYGVPKAQPASRISDFDNLGATLRPNDFLVLISGHVASIAVWSRRSESAADLCIYITYKLALDQPSLASSTRDLNRNSSLPNLVSVYSSHVLNRS